MKIEVIGKNVPMVLSHEECYKREYNNHRKQHKCYGQKCNQRKQHKCDLFLQKWNYALDTIYSIVLNPLCWIGILTEMYFFINRCSEYVFFKLFKVKLVGKKLFE